MKACNIECDQLFGGFHDPIANNDSAYLGPSLPRLCCDGTRLPLDPGLAANAIFRPLVAYRLINTTMSMYRTNAMLRACVSERGRAVHAGAERGERRGRTEHG